MSEVDIADFDDDVRSTTSKVAVPELEELKNKFDLNEDSTSLLYAVHPEVQQVIIDNFEPKSNGPYDKVFQSYARSKAMKFFAQQWGLDKDSSDLLFKAPAECQIDMMATFKPKQYTSGDDINPLFKKYAKGVVARSGRPTKEAGGGGGHKFSGMTIGAFCRKWGLDTNSKNALHKLDSADSAKIIEAFAPNDTPAEHINNKFMSFMSSRVGKSDNAPVRTAGGKPTGAGRGRAPDMAEIKSFCKRNRLPTDCGDLIAALPQGVAQNIMSDFKPKGDTADAEKIFRKFVQSRSEVSLPKFVRRFDLDEQALEYLQVMPGHIQREVLEDFAPKEADNYNPLFMGFVRSVAKRHNYTAVREDRNQPRSERGPTKTPHRKVEAFCSKFKLDEACCSKMMSASPEIVVSAMEEFDPKISPGDTRDLSPLFTSFLNSRIKNAGRGGTHGAPVDRRGRPEKREAPRERAPPSRFSPQEKACERFIENCRVLGSSALKTLLTLPVTMQNHVMVHFDPDRAKSDDGFIKFCDTQLRKRTREASPVRRNIRRRV